MNTITVQAHFDGQQIRLDEPFTLKPGTKFFVTIILDEPPYRDVLVCGVSTQLRQQVDNFDEITSPADADFPLSGLLAKSLVRLGFLAVLPRKNIVGSIGAISPQRHRRLLKTLSDYLLGDGGKD